MVAHNILKVAYEAQSESHHSSAHNLSFYQNGLAYVPLHCGKFLTACIVLYSICPRSLMDCFIF
jgi:hypothetical protein